MKKFSEFIKEVDALRDTLNEFEYGYTPEQYEDKEEVDAKRKFIISSNMKVIKKYLEDDDFVYNVDLAEDEWYEFNEYLMEVLRRCEVFLEN